MRTEEIPAPLCPATQIVVSGAVQGMGMRPFVCALAKRHSLAGWVRNTSEGLRVHLEGEESRQRAFAEDLLRDHPPLAMIVEARFEAAEPSSCASFEILPSDAEGLSRTRVIPDIATCAECIRELFDPSNRRYRYPFVTCTSCGPRYSILERLPYDRARTAMADFSMCAECAAEYSDPWGRRFHSQTNSCPVCGPRLELIGPGGTPIGSGEAALGSAAEAIRSGSIVAVKGIGGVHLMVDATDDRFVSRLRERKLRARKPFAVMFPTVRSIEDVCELSRAEAEMLRGPGAPILLLHVARETGLSPSVAPGSRLVGALLPYSPLHHLLLSEIGRPLVVTSANMSSEPMCRGEDGSFRRLAGICDLFLSHDRRIVRALDDSVARFAAGGPVFIRRGRGFSPTYLSATPGSAGVLGIGAQQKSAVAISDGKELLFSEHIGELEGDGALERLAETVESASALSGVEPEIVCRDLHPDYASSRFAEEYAAARSGVAVRHVQHHAAHLFASLAEHPRLERFTAVVWDGTGYGREGALWGGETYAVEGRRIARVASLRALRLVGGERAIREPWRIAAALIQATFGPHSTAPISSGTPTGVDMRIFSEILERGINCPESSGMGRLFDGVSALCGLVQISDFEGEAASRLEQEAYAYRECEDAYPHRVGKRGDLLEIDYRPIVRELCSDLALGSPAGLVAIKFHNCLAGLAVGFAQKLGGPLLLGGGCFQNALLVELVSRRADGAGVNVIVPRIVPPNDAGICVGQIASSGLTDRDAARDTILTRASA